MPTALVRTMLTVKTPSSAPAPLNFMFRRGTCRAHRGLTCSSAHWLHKCHICCPLARRILVPATVAREMWCKHARLDPWNQRKNDATTCEYGIATAGHNAAASFAGTNRMRGTTAEAQTTIIMKNRMAISMFDTQLSVKRCIVTTLASPVSM